MDFLQRDFAAVFLRLIARDRKLSTAIDGIFSQLQENGNRAFYLRYKPDYKNIVLKRLGKIALHLQQLGTFTTIVLICNSEAQHIQMDTLLALCPEVETSDGPYDKALLREKPLRLSDYFSD